jgi:hypothetical protein
MKRIYISIAGGILVPLLLGISSVFLMDVVYEQWNLTWLDWLAKTLLAMVAWPLVLVGPLMPASDNPNPMAPNIRMALIIVAMVLDIVTYSFLTYLVLTYRARRKSLTPSRVV